MKKHLLLAPLMLAILLMTIPAAAGPDINPGLWEFTTETQMQGGGNMQVPPETHTQCITRDDLVPMSQNASQECQTTNVVTSGDTISWDIVCGGQGGQMEGSGEVTYHGDTMDGSMVMAISGTNMQITNTITGRRVGNCNGQPSASSSSPPRAPHLLNTFCQLSLRDGTKSQNSNVRGSFSVIRIAAISGISI